MITFFGGCMTTNTRQKRSIQAFIIAIACILIVGITFAWIGFEAQKEAELNMAKVDLNVTFDMSETLTNVARGETVVNSIKFSPTTSTQDCYVRASLNYSTPNTPTDDEKRFLLSLNYELIPTATDDVNYKWVRLNDGYYYLTNLNGEPLIYTASTAEYSFCNTVTYTGAVSLYGYIDTPSILKLKAEVQAVQSKNITATTIEELSTIFDETFGTQSKLGYIVTFDTDGANAITAQTFLSEGQLVTEPNEPIKLGYNFAGWYTDSEFNNEYVFTTPVSSSFTLYAKFEKPLYTFGELGVDHTSGKKYYVEMGEYPQSLASVTASDVTATSEQITVNDTTCTVYQNNTTDDRYVLYNSNYYLIEPVRWIILGYEEGYDTSTYKFANFTIDGQNAYVDTAKSTPYTGTNGQPGLLVLSEKVLTTSQFDPLQTSTDSGPYNDYSGSTLRTTFELLYNQIFTAEEKTLIKPVTVNSTYSDPQEGAQYGKDMLRNTYLFPLGCHYNTSYTDNYDVNDYLPTDSEKIAYATELLSSLGSAYDWWLRSGSYYSWGILHLVHTSGSIVNSDVNSTNGVRVAFVMSLE